MNNNNINLLPVKNRGRLPNQKILRILSISSYIFLGLISLSSVALFILNKTSSLEKLDKERSQLSSELSRVDSKAGKYIFVNSRLKSISGVISTRISLDNTIDLITTKASSDILISSLDVKDKTVSVTASSASLYSLNTFLDNLVSMVSEKVFGKIVLDDLVFDGTTGKYTLSLKLDLK